ncbi:MAG: T9SS type A sorting domain-containing protein [Crocinitomix sp.]|nr:T9SS type A sorting domain-containing protein [Crocinitomix sp.]
MKILYCLIVFCFASFFSNAQSLEIYEYYVGDPGENIAGTIQDLYCDEEDCYFNILIKNITDETINIGLERHKLIEAAESQDYLSFGIFIDPSESYPVEFVSPLNPFIAPLRVDLDTSSLGTLVAIYRANSSIGCSEYRYYITNEDNEPLDSIDVRFCSTVGIAENEFGISLYPNPAQNQIIITSANNEIEGNLIITDLAGRTVYSEIIQSNGNHTIDLAKLERGIYIVSLVDPHLNEQIFNTKLVLE